MRQTDRCEQSVEPLRSDIIAGSSPACLTGVGKWQGTLVLQGTIVHLQK